MHRRGILTCLLSLALLVGGCQPRAGGPLPAEVGPAPADWPPYAYEEAAGRRAPVYLLEAGHSRVDVLVGRAGPLARFGHEHVVVVDGLEGYLLLDATSADSRGDLRFPLSGLIVDSPEARRRYGKEGEISAEDVAGTRDNLMRAVLDPARWPMATLSITDLVLQGEKASAQILIEISGGRYQGAAPFNLHLDGDRVTVEGTLELSHDELGLEPYSALGGGLRVADLMTVHFSLVGARLH